LARFFALNAQGDCLAEVRLRGVTAVDAEDAALWINPFHDQAELILADVGDNDGVRSEVALYFCPEPVVPSQLGSQSPLTYVVDAHELVLTYPDGPRDCESLLVDPVGGSFVLVSKRDLPLGRVYTVPFSERLQADASLLFEGTVPFYFTVAADSTWDGRLLLFKTYRKPVFNDQVFVFVRTGLEPLSELLSTGPCLLPVAEEPQGESLAWDQARGGFFTLSEGVSQPLYRSECLAYCGEPLVLSDPLDLNGDGQRDGLDWSIQRLSWTVGSFGCDMNQDKRWAIDDLIYFLPFVER
jgi:hypothetical protein